MRIYINKSLTKLICIGATLEWFDIFIFASSAKILSEKFFPYSGSSKQLLAFWLSFFAGMIFRPIGAYFFGWLGDLQSKKKCLLATLWMQAWGIAMIGFLPSYEIWGIFSTFLLVLLRCAQGFAFGGSYAGIYFLLEASAKEKRSFLANLPLSVAPLGLLLAFVLSYLFSEYSGADFYSDIGWRIPFLFALFPLLYFVLASKNLPDHLFDTAELTKDRGTENKFRCIEWVQKNRFSLVKGVLGLGLAQAVLWYVAHNYSLYFLAKVLHVNLDTANIVIIFSTLISAPFFMISGAFIDYIGRKKILLIAIACSILLYIPVYVFITRASGFYFGNPFEEVNANISILVILVGVQMILAAIGFSAIHGFWEKIFSGPMKYRAIFLAYQCSNFMIAPLILYTHPLFVHVTGNMYAGLLLPIIFLLLAGTICGIFVEE